jgi:SAM-dependent methyltransferase
MVGRPAAGLSRRIVRAARRRGRGVIHATTRRMRRVDAISPVGIAGDPALTGQVEVFDLREIVGWVSGPTDMLPAQVGFYVNELRVAATWSQESSELTAAGEASGSFRIPLSDVWKYCRRSDRLTVQVNGRPLPIEGSGTYRVPEQDGTSTLRDLQRKFDQGFVFSRTGRLQLSKRLDSVWQAAVLNLYDQVSDVVRQWHGHELFAIYGTLLGMVREGGFIGHDNDFDVAYISASHDGRAAAREVGEIAVSLIDAGFDVECRRTALHIHDRHNPRTRMDVFHLYFDDHGDLAFPYGVAGSSVYTRTDWRGLEDQRIARHTLKVPEQAESLVEYIYGASWRTPLPGFNWNRARTSWRKDGWIPHDVEDAVYWSNFYAQNEFAEPSALCEFVLSRSDVPMTVVDIGCGDGRDSLPLARTGRQVCGVDRSQIAIRNASKRARDAGLGLQTLFVTADVADADSLNEIIGRMREQAAGGPLLFYLRNVVHAVTPTAGKALLGAIAELSRSGDLLAAEFPIAADGATKRPGQPSHRHRDGFTFGAAVRDQCGFTIVQEERSAGLASDRGDDPVVYRMVASRT